MTAPPWRVTRPATKAMRRMLVSRSSREKPSPLERCVRTTSPSSTSGARPRAPRASLKRSARVVLPAPESPVSQMVKPVRGELSTFLSDVLDISLLILRGWGKGRNRH